MHTTKNDVRPLARLFRVLGDETRLRIVALLAHGELCVCHLQEALELPQPTVSRHLATLRAAGLVDDRREGTWIHYRLLAQADPECERLLRSLAAGFRKDGVLRRRAEELVERRGPGACR